MVIIFDLDDTLYDERTYVESGFLAVAHFGFEKFDWNVQQSFHFMINTLEKEGRGSIFDKWLMLNGRYSKQNVQECLRIYRHHNPTIELYQAASQLLKQILDYPLYLVTDGHKIVQQKKVESLNISEIFRHIFITHRYGICHAKPSTYCFQRIREREKCKWQDMIYIGDNPVKDFVNLKPLGVHTVRVLTGIHSTSKATPEHNAHHIITNLTEFYPLLAKLNQ